MGDSLDWNRFWEQFESEIDKTSKPAVTKFAYLRELLGERPKTEILGLPYTEDGHKKAKEVLKAKYGVTSEIIQARGKQIMNLPVITSVNLKQIHEFYRLLNVSVNSLRTLGKLDTAEILVRETLDKLCPIKADLTRTDSKWQEWGFDDLLTALRDFTLRNPENSGSIENDKNGRRPPRGEKQFQGTENRGPKCVYCNSTNHRCSVCDKVKLLSPLSLDLSFPINQFTPLLVSIIVIAIIYHVYAVHTIEVEVNNNKFEYWSYNYLGYTMSHTSTCPITYLHQNTWGGKLQE